MDEFFKKLFASIENHFGGFGVLICAIIVILYLYPKVIKYAGYLGKFLPDSMLNKSLFFGLLRLRNKDLKDHIIFKKFEYLLSYRLDNLSTRCLLRKAIYSSLMKIRIQIYKNEFNSFVQNDNFNQLTPQEFRLSLMSLLDRIMKEWVQQSQKEGIPQFIIDRFSSRVLHVVNGFVDEYIQNISDSTYLYYDNNDRMRAILDLSSVIEEYVLNLLEEMLDSFNGEIKGLVFHGIQCKQCEKCVGSGNYQDKMF